MFWQVLPGFVVGRAAVDGAGAGGGGSGPAFNSGDKSANITLSNANLTVSHSGGSDGGVRSTTAKPSGKFYVEFTTNAGFTGSDSCFGIASATANLGTVGSIPNGACITYANGALHYNPSNLSISISNLTSAVICIAVDLDNNRMWFRKNGGDWNNNATYDPASNTGGIDISSLFASNDAYVLFASDENTSGGTLATTTFTYTAPSGFGAW